jgi:hypothetical protein
MSGLFSLAIWGAIRHIVLFGIWSDNFSKKIATDHFFYRKSDFFLNIVITAGYVGGVIKKKNPRRAGFWDVR